MAKSRTHVVKVSVRFDIPITRAEAVAEFRDCVHGGFYPGCFSDAGTMKIGATRSGAGGAPFLASSQPAKRR